MRQGYATVCPYVDHTDAWRAIAKAAPVAMELAAIGLVLIAAAYVLERRRP